MGSYIWLVVLFVITIYKLVSKKEMEQKKKSTGQTQTTVMPERHFAERKNQPVTSAGGHVRQNPSAGAAEGSTMAYLNEKARQDAIEHAKDKMDEKKRLYKNYGGLRVAGRLYDGDPVPNGSKCVICGYCAAENLVPVTAREKYSCYFCREPL